ncbi:MAG: FHA domain-containing protein [Actinomycetota bacterium]
MTPFALSAIKYGLLVLLYLFIWRSLRRVVRDVRTQSPSSGRTRGRSRAADDAPTTTASIIVVHEPDGAKPRTFKLATSMLVGRAAECEIRVDDTYASQQHARVFGRSGGWYVEDLGSTNGTFVNDQRLGAPAMVQPGDKIRVGTTVLELKR